MLVYRSAQRIEDTATKLIRLLRSVDQLTHSVSPAHDDVQGLLIELGEFEAGMADTICARAATVTPELDTLRRASVCAGHLLRESWAGGEKCPLFAKSLRTELGQLCDRELPHEIRTSVPEGYAWYALYPEMYLRAAEKFCQDRTPGRAVVVGIRGIGAGLSGVVAAAVENRGWTTHAYTVRPGGHPFDRRVSISPQLSREWREQQDAMFLVVDEGPGLSGSSFAATARAVREVAGVPDSHIVLFPSWNTDGSRFVNSEASREWERHLRFHSGFEDNCFDSRSPLRAALASGMHELSGGKWREVFFEAEDQWPAVQPEHECRKYLSGGSFIKFAGLGRYGTEKRDLAQSIATRGFSPAVTRLEGGFLFRRVASGRPLVRGSYIQQALLERLAEYLAWRKLALPRARSLCWDDMVQMIETNAGEALGRGAPEWPSDVAREFADREACAVDGRMLPHEWIETERGYLKTDAVDHHADHFYPGDADIAWDLAATCVEFALDEAARSFLLERYRALTGDTLSARLLRFFEIAWTSFRAGYVSLAASAGSQAEHSRWQKERLRYELLLGNAVEVRTEQLQVPA